MCLIIVAHRISPRFPLVIAANRDEDHLRPSRALHEWDDAPDVLGGRDLLAGGSWLAIRRGGRWAAVTNMRGSAKRGDQRSRGALVSSFVLGEQKPIEYASAIAREADAYAGFHLLAGIAGESVVHFASGMENARELPAGIHGVSNGSPDAQWVKVEKGIRAMRESIEQEDVMTPLLAFLATPSPGEPLENNVFVTGDRYGTRSSTVITVGDDAIQFVEQSWEPMGKRGSSVSLTMSSCVASLRGCEEIT